MLNARSRTPSRPRPPAKLRRESAALSRCLSAAGVARDEEEGEGESNNNNSGNLSPVISSPPPAYEVQLALDGHRRDRGLGQGKGRGASEEDVAATTLLGSPIPTTFKLMGYRGSDAEEEGEGGSGGVMEEWMNERSKEELAGLLLKAGDIIKERENELGLTSRVVKGLYESNKALKTNLARIPVTSGAEDSPDRVIPHNTDSPIQPRRFPSSSPSPTPPPPLYRGHARRAPSISTLELSVLSDQNSELMLKLEALEAESTSADHAGRRELRRLEKEIETLRSALEKTQAKSEELEAKTKGLDRGIDKAVEEAWKRKKEREQRMRAMRNSTSQRGHWGGKELRDDGDVDEMGVVRDFAPRGSTFGGPSMSRSVGHGGRGRPVDDDSSFGSTEDEAAMLIPPPRAPNPELEIVAQLLQKVKELEETNSRILHQQAETTSQLQAVQRDTEHITKVYEGYSDSQEFDDEELENELALGMPMDNSMDFGEFNRMSMMSTPSRLAGGRRRVDSTHSIRRGGGKFRRSIHGSMYGEISRPSTPQRHPDVPSMPFPTTMTPSSLPQTSWMHEGRLHRPSHSVASSSGLPSTLDSHFGDDPAAFAELSPLGSRQTLDSELSNGLGWDVPMDNQRHQSFSGWHLRSQSLSNLSQFSVPSSPTPASGTAGVALPATGLTGGSAILGETTPVAFEFPSKLSPTLSHPPRTPSPEVHHSKERTMPGMLPMPGQSPAESQTAATNMYAFPVQPELVVFAPTPSKTLRSPPRLVPSRSRTPHTPSSNGNKNNLAALHTSGSGGMKSPSPRNEFITQRIQARKARWEDERFGSVSSTASVWGSPKSQAPGALYIADGMFMSQQQVFVPPPPSRRLVRHYGSDDGNEEDDEGGEEDEEDGESSSDEGENRRGTVGRGRRARVKMPAPAIRISTVVDTLVDRFQGVVALGEGESEIDTHDETSADERGGLEITRDEHSEYEDAVSEVLNEDTGDEAGPVGADGQEEEDEDETMVNRTPVFISQDNALQLHQYDGMEKMMLKQRKGGSTRSASLSPAAGSHSKLFLAKTSSASGSDSGRQTRKRSQTVGESGAGTSKKANGGPLAKEGQQGGGWGKVLLELWLWLQFAVIVFVFLFAMAKKGPKGVLADAERGGRVRKESIRRR